MNRSKQPPKPRAVAKPDARRVALDVLQDVSCADAYASLSLNKRLQESRLDARDREFVTTLVYGTLEHRMRLDYVVDAHLREPKTMPLLRDLLRMSAYQLLFLDRVPEHAVVDEAVKIAKAMAPHASGLINAVLRNLVRGKADIRWPEDPVEYLSVYHSVPRWLVERLIEAYGRETAEQIVAYRQPEHALTVRPNRMRVDPKAWERRMDEKGWHWKPGRVPDAYQATGVGEIGKDEDFRNGLFSIQGESSMLAVQAVAPRNGWKILDACAAPGGKSAYLAELMQGSGRVFAW
nr:transcription antitermination factor NusB [Clostridia bacterium]